MQRDALDFKHDKVSTLFRRLLLPTLLGTVAIAAMTSIDGIFIGHGVGAIGVAAVNITVPLFQIVAGMALMVGAGCSVVSSIHMARGKVRVARINVTQALCGTTLVVALLCALVFLFTDETARLFGASPTLQSEVCGYLLWMLPGFVLEIWSMIGLFVVRLDGSPKYAMWCNIVPAALNILLDYLFIFPLGMGVRGAAIATSISLAVGGMMAMVYLAFFARSLRLIPMKMSSKSLRLAGRNLMYMCRIGSSSLLGELTLAVLIFMGNYVFMHYLGDDGVGAFGIACYYAPFFFMIGNAVAQSAQPIISYNYGIQRHTQVKQATRLLLLTAGGIGLAVALLFALVPQGLVALFVDTSSRAGRIAVDGFPYFALGVVGFIVNVAVIGYYQSIEQMRRATQLVILRGFALLVPSYLLLPLALGIPGAWLAMPVTEALTLLVIALMWKRRH